MIGGLRLGLGARLDKSLVALIRVKLGSFMTCFVLSGTPPLTSSFLPV